jgi:methionyl-tRNA formyltransferase
MKIVFFGTPEYVLPVIELVHKKIKGDHRSSIVAVVTQSPKPMGRKKILSYSPIDRWAHKKRLPVFYRSPDLVKENIKAELGVLAAYGEIIPNDVIQLFSHGILNIHPSLLPQFRGASPVQAAIATGVKETGVSIIELDNLMDHGPIFSQFKEEVKADDTTESLRQRLFAKGAEVLVELIPHYLQGEIMPRRQEHDNASYTTLVTKAHGFIPPRLLAKALAGTSDREQWEIPFIKNYSVTPTPYFLANFVRALYPWPMSWTEVKLKRKNEESKIMRLKILRAHLDDDILVLDEVQLEGKNAVAWEEFKRGYPQAVF